MDFSNLPPPTKYISQNFIFKFLFLFSTTFLFYHTEKGMK
ncbi:hypothetical protein RV01_GL002252 [Enterococcus dispar]|nr:hypothetical protein RV01_GL002252 [Enterococcus dispar]